MEGGEQFKDLLSAVRAVRGEVSDKATSDAIGDELVVLEGDGTAVDKTASVQRLVGMARVLGAVGDPILDAANKLKELFS